MKTTGNLFQRTRFTLLRASALFGIAVNVHAACPFINSGWDAVSDGIVMNRYSAQITGATLSANTRLATADAAQVKTNLDNVRPQLDVNGDNNITSVDTFVIARYLAGMRGAALTDGLALGSGTRNTNAAITEYINAGCPAPVVARSPIYEALTYVTDRTPLLAQMNAQGARGFQYVGGLVVNSDFFNLYVKVQSATFSYEAQDSTTTSAALLTQLNAQGTRGYRLDGFLTSGTYFVKDNSTTLTYQYELPAAQDTSAGFLTQANAQGARGFFFVFTYLVGGSTVAIYGKDSSSAAYAYQLQPPTDNLTPAQFVSQADTQGASGYKYLTGFFFTGNSAGTQSQNIYVKDTSQNATFSYKAQATTTTSATFITQANTEGALNFVYLSGLAFFTPSFEQRNVYFKPSNCAGWVLCSGGGPF
jgi:hypothetical protein